MWLVPIGRPIPRATGFAAVPSWDATTPEGGLTRPIMDCETEPCAPDGVH